MFNQISAVTFDLEDTLYTLDESAEGDAALWKEIYERLIRHDDSMDSDATIESIQQSIYQNVVTKLQHMWAQDYEKEADFVELFTHALRAAGLAEAEDPHFVLRTIELYSALRASRLIQFAPGALHTLRTLRERGYKLGIVSNQCNLPRVAYASLDQLGLRSHVDVVVLSCEIGWRKPSRHIYDEFIRRLAVAPEATLFVGDRLWEDVFGPREAAMRTVLTHEFRQEDPAQAGIWPDLVIGRLDSLLEELPQL